MAIIGLNVPTEIPWERICVTKDMLDQGVCDNDRPGKWRSSIAVFKYVPEEEYQTYPDREISYLKLVVTVCGFQLKDKEIEGRIDWNGVSSTTIPDVESLLNQYQPCTGALIQLTVGPKEGAANIRPEDYPYIMDCQPKKRELYEMATDTKERMSRSLESLNLRKASGTTQSLEVIDVDQGGGAGGKVLFGALELNGSSQGQWGTKRLSSEEQSVARTIDQGRERRESQSHTTQLSQLYHLFDSYHLGTNRALFFMQPRPHTLEEPSGFVRGPRPVEGIQEIFVVINRPKEGPDYCVSVRLDTSHFVEVPIMDYEWRDEEIELSAAASPLGGSNDPGAQPAQKITIKNRINSWSTLYDCFAKEDKKSTDYVPPGPDFIVDVGKNGGFTVLFEEVNPPGQGKNTHVVEDGILKLRSEAKSLACFISPRQRDDHVDHGLPNPSSVMAVSAKQRVRVHLRSKTQRREVGKRRELMVTTRGLCCCSDGPGTGSPPIEGIASVIPLGSTVATSYLAYAQESTNPTMAVQGHEVRTNVAPQQEGLMSIREANKLSDTIREAMHQSVAQRMNGESVMSLIDTDLFADLMHAAMLKSPGGARNLSAPICECVHEDLLARLRETLGEVADTLTRQDLASQSAKSLAEATGLGFDAARRLRLGLLGIPLVKPLEDCPEDGFWGRLLR